MKTWLWGAGAATLVVAVAVFLSQSASAEGTYTFVIRGDVTAVDRANKTVTIYTRYAPGKAQNDLAGETVEFNVNGARFFKYDANLKKVRTTIGSVPVQAEVVAKGAKRSEGRFNISELTVNPSDFSLVGKVKAHDTTNKIITVEVTSSTYKESSFKGKDVKLYYGDNTTFRNSSLGQINSDELANNGEKIKATGAIISGWKYEVRTVIDGYEKAK